jgi:2-polyprenyl-3-methyl-5-hydroxy-6-metoxy-1,4-benzoquinol methylase
MSSPEIANAIASQARIAHGRIYKNEGNAPVVALLDADVRRVLDVGCGAGDNAELIRSRFPDCEVHGVTHSEAECIIAKRRMASCSVWDIENGIPGDVASMRFDAIMFSHVLEHVRNPDVVLASFTTLLKIGGAVIIAVPNTLSWSMRWRFLRGDFEYRSDGVLDETHLRFFTYQTADKYLLRGNPTLVPVCKAVTGSVPLWWLRRYLLPRGLSEAIDRWGCRRWPNLFGGQILLKCIYRQASVDR